jgi:hypothetical protein
VPTIATILDSPKLAHMGSAPQYPSADLGWGLKARVAALLLTPWRDGHPADRTWTHPFPAPPVSLGVGAVAVACILSALPRWRLRRAAAALGATGVLATALVWQVPGIAHLLGRLPVFRLMVWVRAGFLVSFAVAMPAGIAFDVIVRRHHRMRVAPRYEFLVQRNARYLACPDRVHTVVEVQRRGVLVGWCVAALRGRAVVLGDAPFDSESAARAFPVLLRALGRLFPGAGAVQGWFPAHPEWWVARLRAEGFAPGPEPNALAPGFAFFDPSPTLSDFGRHWYYTMEDSDLF